MFGETFISLFLVLSKQQLTWYTNIKTRLMVFNYRLIVFMNKFFNSFYKSRNKL